MVRKGKRTDEFVPTREFIEQFAKRNGLKIKSIAPYDFKNISGNRGFMVDFGSRGQLNFSDDVGIDHSRYAGEVDLIEPGKLRYEKVYAASGRLDGRNVTLNATVNRSNVKAPEGWGRPQERVDRYDSCDYWFYKSASQ